MKKIVQPPSAPDAPSAMRGVTLRQLKAFAAVVRLRSFARAAAELHLTPSAVSLQIKELERAVALSLLCRSTKAVAPTRAGELLLADVHRMLQALQHAEDTLARMRRPAPGGVAIGMVSSAKYFLPRLLAQFHEAHRDIELHLSVDNREQLIHQVRQGAIDLAIMGQPPADLGARAEAFAIQPLGIIAAPGHPLARPRSLPAAALADQEFIVREAGSGTRAAMERYFRDVGISPPRAMEMSSTGAIKQAVMARMGLAFLSLHETAPELLARQLVAVDVVGLPLLRQWFVVDMAPGAESDPVELLRRFVVERGRAAVDGELAAFAGLRPPPGPDCAQCAPPASAVAPPASFGLASQTMPMSAMNNTDDSQKTSVTAIV